MTIRAAEPSRVGLDFILRAENPRSEAAELSIENWSVIINGKETRAGIAFLPESTEFPIGPKTNALSGIAEVPISLEIDLPLLAADGISLLDELNVDLSIDLLFSYGSADSSAAARLNVVFTPVQSPVFSITEIAVLKDELINTKFRVKIKVDNPNPFPVELSSFKYELYGDNRFWADGNEKNSLLVPGLQSHETELFLTMNFIDMRRVLLDQVINLRDVNFRFKGEAAVGTGVDYLPHFINPFELSGRSRVLDE